MTEDRLRATRSKIDLKDQPFLHDPLKTSGTYPTEASTKFTSEANVQHTRRASIQEVQEIATEAAKDYLRGRPEETHVTVDINRQYDAHTLANITNSYDLFAEYRFSSLKEYNEMRTVLLRNRIKHCNDSLQDLWDELSEAANSRIIDPNLIVSATSIAAYKGSEAAIKYLVNPASIPLTFTARPRPSPTNLRSRQPPRRRRQSVTRGGNNRRTSA